MVKYLIIGSSGYVGSAVAKDSRFAYKMLLAKNSLKDSCSLKTDLILDRNKIEKQIHKFEPEVVINSAWNSVGDYSEDVAMSNIEDQIKLLKQTDAK
jgi:nucleoside-diphosphate-sugar epimerase